MSRKVIYFILLAGVFALAVSEKNEIIIYTHTGAVRGTKIDSDISSFYAFFSIPYAKPPMNSLRFKPPSPIESWEGIHDGTKEGPRCVQIDYDYISEDCLTLTVYSNNVEAVGKPVFVSIHPGALETGTAEISAYGPDYFMRHDIIVVTVQFRLSILGFLNLNLKDAPGNMGLADVIEALKWIKSNIEFFGGDPNSVTVGGTSTGGIMTHALLLSPHAQKLFHKCIISSGTTLSYRFYHDDIQYSIEKTKEVLDMKDSSNEDLLTHLLLLPSSEIKEIGTKIKNLYPLVYARFYGYVITQDYFGIIPENPLELIKKNSYKNLPMLIGINSDEGIRLEADMELLDFLNDNFYLVVPTDLFPIDDMSYEKNETARRIKDFYYGKNELSKDTFTEYVKMCMDSWYGHITDYVVRLQGHLNYNSSIYYYMFAVDGAYNQEKINKNISSPGVNHGDDLGYIWKKDILENIVPTDDFSDISRDRLVAMWSNFVKYGNPTPEVNLITPVLWEPVKYPDIKYLLINQTVSLERNPLLERLQFWQRLYNWTEL